MAFGCEGCEQSAQLVAGFFHHRGHLGTNLQHHGFGAAGAAGRQQAEQAFRDKRPFSCLQKALQNEYRQNSPCELACRGLGRPFALALAEGARFQT
jgi:hypothetical protein